MARKKPYEVLREFTKILHEVDPMGLGSPDESEYESEALSILARFHESGIMGAPDELRSTVASEVVTQTLEYWFDERPTSDCAELTARLLTAFVQKD